MSVNPTLDLFLVLKEQKLKPKVIVSFCSQFYKCKSYFRLVFRVSHCTKGEIKANYEYLARVCSQFYESKSQFRLVFRVSH
jgi:hypothetical protein